MAAGPERDGLCEVRGEAGPGRVPGHLDGRGEEHDGEWGEKGGREQTFGAEEKGCRGPQQVSEVHGLRPGDSPGARDALPRLRLQFGIVRDLRGQDPRHERVQNVRRLDCVPLSEGKGGRGDDK